jgi:adenylate cyclase class IV
MKEIEQRFLIPQKVFNKLKKELKITADQLYLQMFFTDNAEQQLQIRSSGNTWQLRLKSKIDNETDNETELTVSANEFPNLIEFCTKFGYTHLFVISKHRYSSIIGDIKVDLDHFSDPEMFVVELETQSSYEDLSNLAINLNLAEYKINDLAELKNSIYSKSKESYNLNQRIDKEKLLKKYEKLQYI